MANKISVELDIEEQKALRALTALTKKTDVFGKQASKSFGKATSAFNVFTGTLGAIGVTKALSVLSRGLKQAAGDALEFSEAIAEINSILPANDQLTEKTIKTFIKFANSFSGNPQTQAKAFYKIVSAGIKETSNQLAVLRISNIAAAAGLVQIDDAAFALVSSMNAYKDSGLTAQEASDALFVAVREGQTTFNELAQNIGVVASIAAKAGVSFNDLAGTISFVTKGGVKTDRVIIGLRQVLSSVIDPTREAADAAKALGIEFSTRGIRAAGGFAGFLKEVTVATKGSEVALGQLFGNVRALTPILQVAGKNFQDFQRIIGETNNSVGATETAFKRIEASAAFQFKRLIEQISNLPQEFLVNFEKPTAEALKQIREFVGTDGLLLMADTFIVVIDILQEFRRLMNSFIPTDTQEKLEEVTEGILKQTEVLDLLRQAQKRVIEVQGEDDVAVEKIQQKIDRTEALIKTETKRAASLRGQTEAEDEQFKATTKNLENIRTKIKEGRDSQQKDNEEFRENSKASDQLAAEEDLGLIDQKLELEKQKLARFREEQQLLKLEEHLLNQELEQGFADADLEFLAERLGREEAVREQARINRLKANGKLVEAEKKQIATQTKAEKQGIFQRRKFSELSDKQKLNNIKRTSDNIAQLQNSSNSKLAKVGKAFAIFSATIRGAQAVNLALSSAPPPFNFVLAALVGAAALENINKIKNAKPPQGSFQEGGIVGGNSFTGDQLQANVNSGELILNRRQQQNLFEQINSGNTGGGEITVNVNGDRVTDQSMIDSIVEGINEGTEFRNLNLRTG